MAYTPGVAKDITPADFIWDPTVSYDVGRTMAIDTIAIHWWDLPENYPTLQGVINHLKNPAVEVSAHFVVSGETIVYMVDTANTAWNVLTHNPHIIGIENDPNPPAGHYETLAGLIRYLRNSTGLALPLKGHGQFTNNATSCPGFYVNDFTNLNAMAAQSITPPPPPVETTTNFYFDAHTSLQDVAAVWGNEHQGFDNDINSLAAAGSSGMLIGTGTNAVNDGKSVTQVQVRMKAAAGGESNKGAPNVSAAIYSDTQLLGGLDTTSTTPVFTSWSTLTTPTGGWTWSKVQNLRAEVNGEGMPSLYIIELNVTSALIVPTPAVGEVRPNGRPVKVWNGSTWITRPPKAYDGTEFKRRPAAVYDGTNWV